MDGKIILEKLEHIERLLQEQNILKKEVLDTREAAKYIGFSEGYLYQLTSGLKIPFFRPNGKRIYFNRKDLDKWLQRNRQDSKEEIIVATMKKFE